MILARMYAIGLKVDILCGKEDYLCWNAFGLVVHIVVDIVVVILAEFYSRIVVEFGPSHILGTLYLQGRCCRNFGRQELIQD